LFGFCWSDIGQDNTIVFLQHNKELLLLLPCKCHDKLCHTLKQGCSQKQFILQYNWLFRLDDLSSIKLEVKVVIGTLPETRKAILAFFKGWIPYNFGANKSCYRF
jgi:hypothetical protein